ncbi:cystatin-like fold lipoprotein, partial [Staphylococcus pettenkoferi]
FSFATEPKIYYKRDIEPKTYVKNHQPDYKDIKEK